MRECEWRMLKATDASVRKFVTKFAKSAYKCMTEGDILASVSADRIFGLV
jgi:hypothetical protein